MNLQKFKYISLLLSIAVITTACGSPDQTQSEIETAVAQTVQAQNALTKVSALPTLTPASSPQGIPTLPAAITPETVPTDTPAPIGNPGCVASAQLVAENPPDQTLLSPGEYFWKTWTFLNTGTCYWTTEYSLVFWDGELMGGLTSYPFTDDVAPGETYDLSIYLQAPVNEGMASGLWRFKTPWDEYFGVGAQNISFYVQINVSTNLQYKVTNVEYTLVREPQTGCQLNVRYTVYATVITNGPTEFDYRWDQSDGNESGIKHVVIDEAGTKTFKRSWLISNNDSPNPRWIKFIIVSPESRDFGRVDILHDCFIN